MPLEEISPCGYEPDQEYIQMWKNPSSLQNKRLEFVKSFPLKKIYRISRLEFRNGIYKLPDSVNIDLPDTDSPETENPLVERKVPILAHIIRRSDGTEGLSTTDLNDAISIAQGFYNSFHFILELAQINYIDSETIFDNQHLSSVPAASNNILDVTSRNIDRHLNIYFVPNSNTSWAWRPNTGASNQHILMNNNQTKNGTTLSHELGHWFDLLHTHSGGDELVDGSNCSTAGDFVCDTPADPNLSGLVNTDCEYTGNLVDANGDPYNPDPRNLLSYAGSCRDRFSQGQIERMEAAYLGMDTDRGYTFITDEIKLPETGFFTIQQKSNERFLDAHEDSENDFSVVTRAAQDNDSQRWKLNYLGGVYNIKQKNNLRFLDAHDTSGRDFSLVTRNSQNNDTQRWALYPDNNDLCVYRIQQLSSRRFVDAHESSGHDFYLVTRTIQNNDTQKWILKALGNNTFTIQQKSNQRFVDAHTGSNDFSVVSRTAQNNDTQQWVFELVGGIYSIQQRSNNRVVDAWENSAKDFSVVTRTDQNNDTQKCILSPIGEDSYTIQQLINGRFFDAHEHSGLDFSVVTRTAQNNDSQNWIIRSV